MLREPFGLCECTGAFCISFLWRFLFSRVWNNAISYLSLAAVFLFDSIRFYVHWHITFFEVTRQLILQPKNLIASYFNDDYESQNMKLMVIIKASCKLIFTQFLFIAVVSLNVFTKSKL